MPCSAENRCESQRALGLAGRWITGDPAVSERRARPARSTDRQPMLTRILAAAWLSPTEPNNKANDRSDNSGTDTYRRDNGNSHGTDMDSRSRGAHQC